jgi:hypothetical protein
MKLMQKVNGTANSDLGTYMIVYKVAASVGDKRTDNSNTVGPQYPQILPLRTQPTVD